MAGSGSSDGDAAPEVSGSSHGATVLATLLDAAGLHSNFVSGMVEIASGSMSISFDSIASTDSTTEMPMDDRTMSSPGSPVSGRAHTLGTVGQHLHGGGGKKSQATPPRKVNPRRRAFEDRLAADPGFSFIDPSDVSVGAHLGQVGGRLRDCMLGRRDLSWFSFLRYLTPLLPLPPPHLVSNCLGRLWGHILGIGGRRGCGGKERGDADLAGGAERV